MTTFTSFGLPSFLCKSLDQMRIVTPTPIQGKAIPPGLEGQDILASAQTGTGKTIAYLLPLITNMLKTPKSTALVLAPTRDLALQIQETARALLGRELDSALLIGGSSMDKQFSALKRHPRLIIGTPGRVNDHIARRTLHLQETRFLVLDEADRMLDMGFSEALKKIVSYLPKERQTFMFSATLPSSIKTLSLTYLTDPHHVSVGSATEPSIQIKQESIELSATEKFPSLLNELNKREGSIIVFVKTKRSADRLAERLTGQNHHAVAVHGNLRQSKREKVIKDFRNLKMRIMVATDLAARGLDIPHIMHVINYDLPQCPEDYIHRIGRTGRAGKEGSAISLISPDESQIWRRIHKLIQTGVSEPFSRGPKKSSGSFRNSDKPRRFSKDSGKPRRFREDSDKPRNFSNGSDKPRRFSKDSDKPRDFSKSSDKPRRFREDSDKPRDFSNDSDKPRRFSKDSDKPRDFSNGSDKPKHFLKNSDKPRDFSRGSEKPHGSSKPFHKRGKSYGKPERRLAS